MSDFDFIKGAPRRVAGEKAVAASALALLAKSVFPILNQAMHADAKLATAAKSSIETVTAGVTKMDAQHVGAGPSTPTPPRKLKGRAFTV